MPQCEFSAGGKEFDRVPARRLQTEHAHRMLRLMKSFGRRLVSWTSSVLVVLVATACVSQFQCKEVEGQEKCVATGGPKEAIGSGAAAGALWVAGGGCAVAGCHPPMYCNRKTGFCEHLTCGEGSGGCPDGLSCDSRTHTCR